MSTHEQATARTVERGQDEVGPAEASAPTPIDGLGARSLTPAIAAETIRRRPDQQSAIIARLHTTMGAAFVRQVLAVLETPASPPSQESDAATSVSMSSLAESDESTTAAPSGAGQPASFTDPVSVVASAPPVPVPAASPSFQVPAVVRVIASDGLHVRRTPDATAHGNVIGALSPHVEIEALARDGEWLRVDYRGHRAYIHGGFVELAPHAEVATDSPGPAASQPAPHAAANGGAASGTQSSLGGPTTTSSSQAPTAGTSPAVQQPETAVQPADGEFVTLSGNAIAKTTAKEAAVLNSLRADPRRFDPAWLALAQRTLGVVDATGAMNTETLRALRTRAGNPSLGADGILNVSFLAGIAPGNPFASNELGFAEHAADPRARTQADRAAQAVGYASFAEYKSDWVPITFLGRNLGPPNGGGSGRGHPYLAARLHVAETFLRQRHAGLDDADVRQAIGWNGKGNAAYGDEIGTQTSHQHTMGLAIDIDPAHNPYIFNETGAGLPHDQAMWWIETFEAMFRIATKIYGGEAITPSTLMQWSKTSSSEELIKRVQATSSAFRRYLELSGRPEREILAALTAAGYSDAEARAELPNVQRAENLFHRGGGRQHASTITNIQAELLVALRDVAGLSWGGTEMSMRENGDFMHFDCRNTTFGYAVYSRTAPTHR